MCLLKARTAQHRTKQDGITYTLRIDHSRDHEQGSKAKKGIRELHIGGFMA